MPDQDLNLNLKANAGQAVTSIDDLRQALKGAAADAKAAGEAGKKGARDLSEGAADAAHNVGALNAGLRSARSAALGAGLAMSGQLAFGLSIVADEVKALKFAIMSGGLSMITSVLGTVAGVALAVGAKAKQANEELGKSSEEAGKKAAAAAAQLEEEGTAIESAMLGAKAYVDGLTKSLDEAEKKAGALRKRMDALGDAATEQQLAQVDADEAQQKLTPEQANLKRAQIRRDAGVEKAKADKEQADATLRGRQDALSQAKEQLAAEEKAAPDADALKYKRQQDANAAARDRLAAERFANENSLPPEGVLNENYLDALEAQKQKEAELNDRETKLQIAEEKTAQDSAEYQRHATRKNAIREALPGMEEGVRDAQAQADVARMKLGTAGTAGDTEVLKANQASVQKEREMQAAEESKRNQAIISDLERSAKEISSKNQDALENLQRIRALKEEITSFGPERKQLQEQVRKARGADRQRLEKQIKDMDAEAGRAQAELDRRQGAPGPDFAAERRAVEAAAAAKQKEVAQQANRPQSEADQAAADAKKAQIETDRQDALRRLDKAQQDQRDQQESDELKRRRNGDKGPAGRRINARATESPEDKSEDARRAHWEDQFGGHMQGPTHMAPTTAPGGDHLQGAAQKTSAAAAQAGAAANQIASSIESMASAFTNLASRVSRLESTQTV